MTTYKMIDIEGVGETYAKKLEEAGIKDSADLLKKAATRTGRAELEEATGISGKLILSRGRTMLIYAVSTASVLSTPNCWKQPVLIR